MDEHFVHQVVDAGANNGPSGMWPAFYSVRRPALSNLHVHIRAQVAEGKVVTTRKTIAGTHAGPLLGIAPTGQSVAIDVLDRVRLCSAKYCEHQGLNTLAAVLAYLRPQ